MTLARDLGKLVQPQGGNTGLDPAGQRPALPARTGLEAEKGGKVQGREISVKSTDGLFLFTVRVVKT